MRLAFVTIFVAGALAGASPAPMPVGGIPRVVFEPNLRQANSATLLVGRAPGYTVLLGKDGRATYLNARGSAWDYVTYLGGRAPDQAYGIAEDASGNAYVTGAKYSDNFPVTAGAYQTVRAGSYDAFVAKIAASGNALVYATLV